MLVTNHISINKRSLLLSIVLLSLTLTDCNRKKQAVTTTEASKTKTYQQKPKQPAIVSETIKQDSSVVLSNKTEIEKKNESANHPKTPDNTNLKTTLTQHKFSTQEKKKLEEIPPTKHLPSHYKIYANLKRILESIKTGETATKEELIATNAVPNDALKIVKSIRKVSDNELEVKWKSAWMVERISDVKLNDDIIKIKFGPDVVYTSGNAIGIEYNDKVYNNLIIKGDRAYIPSIKEYSWKIGR